MFLPRIIISTRWTIYFELPTIFILAIDSSHCVYFIKTLYFLLYSPYKSILKDVRRKRYSSARTLRCSRRTFITRVLIHKPRTPRKCFSKLARGEKKSESRMDIYVFHLSLSSGERMLGTIDPLSSDARHADSSVEREKKRMRRAEERRPASRVMAYIAILYFVLHPRQTKCEAQ